MARYSWFWNEGKTVGAVARELDLTASALTLWVRHARAERMKGKSGLLKEEREESPSCGEFDV